MQLDERQDGILGGSLALVTTAELLITALVIQLTVEAAYIKPVRETIDEVLSPAISSYEVP